MAKRTADNRGFTLLEVMITLIVFAVGLLGVAGLQMMSLRLISDSYYRTIAAIQVNDMIDRMRANNPMVRLGIDSPYNLNCTNIDCSLKEVHHPTCFTTGCTPKEMAEEDIYEWLYNISELLPSGKGIVCIDSSPKDGKVSDFTCDNIINTAGSPIFAIKVFWMERKDANNTNNYHRQVNSFSL